MALVTGAAGSIGRAAVHCFRDEGARVFALDRDWGAAGASDSGVDTVRVDVTDETGYASAVATCLAQAGRIDVLFNNAGIEGVTAEIADYPLDAFRKVLEVNVVGVFLGMKLVLPHMALQGSGSIINASSMGGLRGARGMSAYVASKHRCWA